MSPPTDTKLRTSGFIALRQVDDHASVAVAKVKAHSAGAQHRRLCVDLPITAPHLEAAAGP